MLFAKRRGALIATDFKTQRMIGSSRFHGYDEGRSEVEIGWTFLARPYRGGIYNAELKGARCNMTSDL
jgi:RimJ/RimL family protein N-acetyltransferase